MSREKFLSGKISGDIVELCRLDREAFFRISFEFKGDDVVVCLNGGGTEWERLINIEKYRKGKN